MSWTKNLQRPGSTGNGFWSDDHWYELQSRHRLPLVRVAIKHLILSLPALHKNATILDLLSGSGQLSVEIVQSFPYLPLQITLLDSSQSRLSIAQQKLSEFESQPQVFEFVCANIVLDQEPVAKKFDLIVGSLALHVLVGHVVEKSEAEKRYLNAFRLLHKMLKPRGHLIFVDHVGSLRLGRQLELLIQAGFEDVDVSWRHEDFFVAGGVQRGYSKL
jgi:SAM-dependent methyltransferase